jgi:hypothetical protein
MDWISILKDLGLLGLVGIILKWMFTEQSRINTQIDTERKKWMEQSDAQTKRWQEIMSNYSVCQTQMMTEHRDYREQVNEAHKFQRDEHIEMIGQLKEITVTLGRINGYKKE